MFYGKTPMPSSIPKSERLSRRSESIEHAALQGFPYARLNPMETDESGTYFCPLQHLPDRPLHALGVQPSYDPPRAIASGTTLRGDCRGKESGAPPEARAAAQRTVGKIAETPLARQQRLSNPLVRSPQHNSESGWPPKLQKKIRDQPYSRACATVAFCPVVPSRRLDDRIRELYVRATADSHENKEEVLKELQGAIREKTKRLRRLAASKLLENRPELQERRSNRSLPDHNTR